MGQKINFIIKDSEFFYKDFGATMKNLLVNPEGYFKTHKWRFKDNDCGIDCFLLAKLVALHTKPISIYVGVEYTSELQKKILPESNDKEYYLDIDLPDKVDYVTYWASDYGDSLKEALKQLCIDHGLTTFYEKLFGENEQII